MRKEKITFSIEGHNLTIPTWEGMKTFGGIQSLKYEILQGRVDKNNKEIKDLLQRVEKLEKEIKPQPQPPSPPPPESGVDIPHHAFEWPVVVVNTLAPEGEGSLKWALDMSGPRRIVFDVAGVIDFRPFTSLQIKSPNVLIDGWTAASPGIHLFGAEIINRCENVYVRDISVYAGDEGGGDLSERDCFKAKESGVVYSHCAFFFSVDEIGQVTGSNVHFNDCLFALPLVSAKHHKGAHPKGVLVIPPSDKRSENVTFLRSAWIACEDRHPQWNPDSSGWVVNCYMYQGKWGPSFNLKPGIKGPKVDFAYNEYEKIWAGSVRFAIRENSQKGSVYLRESKFNGKAYKDPWELVWKDPSGKRNAFDSRAESPNFDGLWGADAFKETGLRDTVLKNVGPKHRPRFVEDLFKKVRDGEYIILDNKVKWPEI